MNGVLDVIFSQVMEKTSKAKIVHETILFRDRQESFGMELAVETSKTTQPGSFL